MDNHKKYVGLVGSKYKFLITIVVGLKEEASHLSGKYNWNSTHKFHVHFISINHFVNYSNEEGFNHDLTFGISPKSSLASAYIFFTSSNWSANPRLKAWNCRFVYWPPIQHSIIIRTMNIKLMLLSIPYFMQVLN